MRMFDKNSIGLDVECPVAALLHPLVSSDFHIFVNWMHRGTAPTKVDEYIPNPGTSNVGCGAQRSAYGPLKLRLVRLMLSSHPDFEATKRKRPKDMDPEFSKDCNKYNIATPPGESPGYYGSPGMDPGRREVGSPSTECPPTPCAQLLGAHGRMSRDEDDADDDHDADASLSP